jgi:hypothetical protein
VTIFFLKHTGELLIIMLSRKIVVSIVYVNPIDHCSGSSYSVPCIDSENIIKFMQ